MRPRGCPDSEWVEIDDEPVVEPDITVWVDDPEPLGSILGPDGQPLHTVFPPRQPFGFGRS